MKIDQLKYFIETAKHEHVGKASRALNISPSTVSHAIANLEDELGRELFSRQGKRIFLTSHGRLLLERASALIAEADRIFEDIQSDRVEVQGHYRLAATHVLCEDFLTPAWTKIQSEHTKVSGEIFTFRSAEVLKKVSESEIDLGLCLSPQAHPKIEIEHLYEGDLIIVARRKHPLSRIKGGEQVRALSTFGSVLPKAFQGIESCESHPAIEKCGIESETKLMYDSYSVALEAVYNTDMWTLLPNLLFEKYSKNLISIVPRGWHAPYSISAVWPKNRVMTRLLSELKLNLKNNLEAIER